MVSSVIMSCGRNVCSLIMVVQLVFIIFFYIKHLILWSLHKFTATRWRLKLIDVTASSICIWVPTSRINFSRRVETEVLISFIKLIYVVWLHSTSFYTRRSGHLLFICSLFFLLINLRVSSQNWTWFLVFGLLNFVFLLLCYWLFWSYLIHRFCTYSYSWFWLYFHWNLLSIICDHDTTITLIFVGYFAMLLLRIVWSQ